MNDLTLEAENLVVCVSDRLKCDIDDFPKSAISIYGQALPLFNNSGKWTKYIHLEHIGYVSRKLRWGDRFHTDDYVEWIVRAWTIDRLESTLNIKIILAAHKKISSLEINTLDTANIEETLFHWCKDVAIKAQIHSDYDTAFAVRSLYQWCVEEDLPEFSEHRLFELSNIKLARREAGLLVTMRDEDFGPYTSVELSFIEREINVCGSVTPAEKTAYYLARDWGLRPIQLSLLHLSDYGRDELGPFMMVPCVKGTKRSVLRRATCNLVKRYIADDTAAAVEAQIHIAPEYAAEILEQTRSLIGEAKAQDLPIPLFPAKSRTEIRLRRFCNNPKLLKYALHCDSHSISRMMINLTSKLNIPRPMKASKEADEKPLYISAYRFRRTKGTTMVLAGATAEEVAEALDHVSTDSIKYYFRYNLELHDFINRAHAASPEITRAVQMWQGRLDNMQTFMPGEIKIGNLGKCMRGSPCPHHPTVSCYSCPSFRPGRNANHTQALADIEEFQKLIALSSTGPITQQLEISIHGAKAVILAITAEGDYGN